MKENKKFKIDIYGLKNGTHEFDFEFGNELFEGHEDGIIENGSGNCAITLKKRDSIMEMSFLIKGKIELTCDRSLERFNFPITLNEKLIIKYGDMFDDSREDLWIIPFNELSVNIEQPLYEYLSLSVPMKKIHPDYQDDDEEGLTLVYATEEPDEDIEEENKESDPRWDALKNIKNIN